MRWARPTGTGAAALTPTAIARIQRRIGVHPDGQVGVDMTQKIRDFQRERGLVVNGELDSRTLAAIEALGTAGLIPKWWGTDRQYEVVSERLGGTDPNTVRRYQSAAGVPLTGWVDEATAVRIGD